VDAYGAESSLCAAVRGAPDVWRGLHDAGATAAFLAAASAHRLRPMLAWRLRQTGELACWPAAVRQSLADAERAEAALEIVRRRELSQLVRAFATADVPLLLIKGAALAYAIYPEPWLRPREDTDLLVRGVDARRASGVLTASGYRAAVMQSGELVTHQRLHVRSDPTSRRHDCDLHWKIANPVAFADLLSADELLAAADSVALGDSATARVPRRIHALLLACWHRVAHHYDSRNLLWLCDLHLLAEGMTDADASELLEAARRTGTGEICARGLRSAAELFDTRLPGSLLTDLQTSWDGRAPLAVEPFGSGGRKVDRLLADMRALPRWRSRLRLLREHLFPPADYMVKSYGWSHRVMLPLLYAWRIVRGAPGWFRRL
jgi:hypothetical protein